MKIYCTICCKEKRIDKCPIKAIDRYLSDRINSVYKKAKKDNVEFRIFSGKFGLLKPDKKILFYDQKLTEEKIPELKSKIKKQISSEKIDSIIFFVKDIKENLGWIIYVSLMQEICSETNTFLEIRNIK